MGMDDSLGFCCATRGVKYVEHVLTVHWLRWACSGLTGKSLYKKLEATF